LQAGGRGFESRRLHQPNKINALRDFGPLERPEKAGDHPQTGFQAALEAFLLSRRVGNCSPRTIGGYTGSIQRLAQTLGLRDLRDATSLGIQRYLSGLSETMKPASVHHYFRPLKTFFRWCVETGLLQITRCGASSYRAGDEKDRRALPSPTLH
jgi:site-specific recombinase XerD